MTRNLANLAIWTAALVSLSGCASYESDPSKIPDPVKPSESAASTTAPGAVAESKVETTNLAASTHSGRASEPGAE